MATVVETVEREGRTIAIYDNGMERDVAGNKIIKAPPSALITPRSSHIMRQKRAEKTARLLRDAIVTETMDKLEVPHHGSAAAVAAAGGILWREIVLNAESYDRDRLEAFEKLGRIAELIPNTSKRDDEEKTTGAQMIALATGTAQLLASVWSDVMQLHAQPNVVEGALLPETDISGSNNLRIDEQDKGASTPDDEQPPDPPLTSDRTE